MGSGDPSGLQNRRELASLALVSSTLTRFRQFFLRVLSPSASLGSGFRLAAQTPQKRLNFKTGEKFALLALGSSNISRFRLSFNILDRLRCNIPSMSLL